MQGYNNGTSAGRKTHMAPFQTFHSKVKFNHGDKQTQAHNSKGASKQLNPT